LARKGAKSHRRIAGLRSKTTKARARVSNGPNSSIELKKQLEARTRELAEARGYLSEAVERQAATDEVLRVISSSPGDVEPVFQAVLENATRLCDAKFGTLNLYHGEVFRNVALYNVPSAYLETKLHEVIRPHPKSGHAHIVRTKQAVHIEDLTAMPPYRGGDPAVTALADLGGARTIVVVPMLKEDELIGTIGIYRQEVRPFTEKQIELVTNFAAQAVIAIENTRLLKELRQRTDDLTESLEQQTATSEVLRVISSSPGELEAVFQAILANAVRICGAKLGDLYLREADGFRMAATHKCSARLCRGTHARATAATAAGHTAGSRCHHQTGRPNRRHQDHTVLHPGPSVCPRCCQPRRLSDGAGGPDAQR
jgi:GAF domain-containing protein